MRAISSPRCPAVSRSRTTSSSPTSTSSASPSATSSSRSIPDAYDARFKRWKFEDLPIVPDEFRYEPRDAKAGKQLKSLHAAMRRKDIDGLVNACDAGREGELIFKLILQTAKVRSPCAARGSRR